MLQANIIQNSVDINWIHYPTLIIAGHDEEHVMDPS